MKIKFLGALEQVTGSATLLEHNDTQILVDFGYEQGESPIIDCNPFESINITKLKAVFLTHAHLDHCGMLPLLYQKGYSGKVFSTKATAQLAPYILKDCAKLGAPYSDDDIAKIQWHSPDMSANFDWQKPMALTSDGLEYYFQPTGHIVGAVSIGFMWKQETDKKKYELLFSGDLGYNYLEQTANLLNSVTMLPRASVTHLICESTYGDRKRNNEEKHYINRLNQLKSVLEKTVVNHHCRLLIPAFSMHRTQELILDTYIAMKQLNKPMYRCVKKEVKPGQQNESLIDLKIDTTLGNNISKVYRKRLTDFLGKNFGQYKNISFELLSFLDLNHKDAHTFLHELFGYSNGHWKNKYEFIPQNFKDDVLNMRVWGRGKAEDIKLPKQGAQMVIASSGMMSDGPMKTWMEGVLDDPNTYIAVTGYQAEGTIGKKLVDMIDNGLDDFISLGSRIYTRDDIKCKLVHLNGYSGHADQKDLLYWASGNLHDAKAQKRELILNHGTNEMRKAFAEAWEIETGLQAIIPTRNNSVIQL